MPVAVDFVGIGVHVTVQAAIGAALGHFKPTDPVISFVGVAGAEFRVAVVDVPLAVCIRSYSTGLVSSLFSLSVKG
jgi:hypothetical protein